jgi:hypothetical protein
LEVSDHWGIFEVVQSGKSYSQVGLWRIVNFVSMTLEVPGEISRTRSVGTRWIIVASLLWGSWCRRCLLPDVGIDLTGVSRLLACTWAATTSFCCRRTALATLAFSHLDVVHLFLHLEVVHPQRRPRSGDLGFRTLLPDSSRRSLYG